MMRGEVRFNGRADRLQNFVVKAFFPRTGGVRKIALDACYGVEVLQGDSGEITVVLVDESGNVAAERTIPPFDSTPKANKECTEIIVENGYGNTVHRWVHGGGRGNRPPNVEAQSLRR
jgi:hypothetical protein